MQWQTGDDSMHTDTDALAREEPLEIRIANVPIAVVMRTPGHDEELVRGFLVTEGIVPKPSAITRVSPCHDVDREDAEDNVVLVRLTPDTELDIAKFRRNLYASSSCGVCGKESIERAMAIAPAITTSKGVLPRQLVCSLPRELRRHQPLFERSGGAHAAGVIDPTGKMLAVREDVGRHNAVDKVVGWCQMQIPTIEPAALIVSGRVSFEIVQKALATRIPIVIAVSAPTSLAVDLARTAGVTLVAFVRDASLRIYAGNERIGESSPRPPIADP